MNISRGKISRPLKVCLYAPEGIGKTTFASQFPDPLFIDTEGGTSHMDVARFDRPETWEELLDDVRYVWQNPTCCKTLVLDTADWAEKPMTEYVLRTNQWKSIESAGYGKGYVYLSEEFQKLLAELDKVIAAGIHVVVTAHAAMRKFEQPDEMGAYDRWEMKLSKKVAPLLKEWCDLLLFANYKTFAVKSGDKVKAQGGKRVMYASHHPCWDAKNRQGLPDEMDFSFSEIAHLFEAEKKPAKKAAKKAAPKPEPAAPATGQMQSAAPEDVTEPHIAAIYDLMARDGVTEEELRKLVASKGHYDFSVPIQDYEKKFAVGWVIKYWDRIRKMIEDARGNQEGR